MQDDWASANLEVIRTLMERSAVYRRALAPVMMSVGVTGAGAGALGWSLKFDSSRAFALYWVGIAVVCLFEALLLIRRQAMRDAEPFWSPPTRRVAQAVAPAFAAGFMTSLLFIFTDVNVDNTWVLVPLWMVFFGLGMHAAGFFMPRGFKVFGWGFALGGFSLFGSLIVFSKLSTLPASLGMGVLFGGGHLLYGIYLHFTEKRPIVP